MIISRKILRNFILLGISIYLGGFGSLLYADAQKKKDPSKQEPPKLDRSRPFMVYGQAVRNWQTDRPVKGIRVKLIHFQQSFEVDKKESKSATGISTQMIAEDSKKKKSTQSNTPKLNNKGSDRRIRHVRIPPKICITDEKGRFSFLINKKYKGHRFTLKIWHPDFPATDLKGKHILVTSSGLSFLKDGFILDRDRKFTICFSPPEFKINVFMENPEPPASVIILPEFALDEVIGPSQYKHIETKIKGYYDFYATFELDYDNKGKKYRLRARHPQKEAFGDGMSPKEKMIKLTSEETKIVFRYTGPLPDLTIPYVRVSPDCIAVTIKNIGDFKAGPFKLNVIWNTYDIKEGKVIHPPEFRQVREYDGLEAKEKHTWFIYHMRHKPRTRLRFASAYVDYKYMVAESNEENNNTTKYVSTTKKGCGLTKK